MGIHLCVYREDGAEDPDWDFTRHAGDREFIGLDLEKIVNSAKWRPDNFPAWREAVRDFPNQERFAGLLDKLEANSRWLLYVSW